jgi:tetratricopeptide (TPR) repeat protein
VDPYLLILIEAFLFILLFGGLSLLRREGLSGQLALEVLAITAITIGTSMLTGLPLDPILFLIFVYLVTMRARLLTDLGNLLSSRGQHSIALTLYQLALRLKPDTASRSIVLINMGVAQVWLGAPAEAIPVLQEVLAAKAQGHLSPKCEAACLYNLGIAYRRAGNDREAVRAFNEVIELYPSSIYAVGANAALRQRAQGQDEGGASDKG